MCCVPFLKWNTIHSLAIPIVKTLDLSVLRLKGIHKWSLGRGSRTIIPNKLRRSRAWGAVLCDYNHAFSPEARWWSIQVSFAEFPAHLLQISRHMNHLSLRFMMKSVYDTFSFLKFYPQHSTTLVSVTFLVFLQGPTRPIVVSVFNNSSVCSQFLWCFSNMSPMVRLDSDNLSVLVPPTGTREIGESDHQQDFLQGQKFRFTVRCFVNCQLLPASPPVYLRSQPTDDPYGSIGLIISSRSQGWRIFGVRLPPRLLSNVCQLFRRESFNEP